MVDRQADRMTIPHTDPETALTIMGGNFIGLEAAARCFRTGMFPGFARQFGNIPYSSHTLRGSALTELLFPDLGLTICELCMMSKGNMFHPVLEEAPCTSELTRSLQHWCEEYHAAHLSEVRRWRLIPVGLIDCSDDLSLASRIGQASEACPDHDNHGGILTPRIVIYAAVLWHLTKNGV